MLALGILVLSLASIVTCGAASQVFGQENSHQPSEQPANSEDDPPSSALRVGGHQRLYPFRNRTTPAANQPQRDFLPPNDSDFFVDPLPQVTAPIDVVYAATNLDSTFDTAAPAGKSSELKTVGRTVDLTEFPGDENAASGEDLPHPLSSGPTGTAGSNKQIGTTEFFLAEQPAIGETYPTGRPSSDPAAHRVEPLMTDFSADPIDVYQPYDGWNEAWIYEGKCLYANRRPLVELGRPWYQLGQLSPGSTILGRHNLVVPQFLVYGDFRSAFASNDLGADTTTQLAYELNLNFDLRITATERFTMFIAPIDDGASNTRWLFDEDRLVTEFDAEVEFGMFEGDLGALWGGAVGQTLPFDLPFAIGVMPLVFQNGVWMEDAVLGVAATIPARNSPRLDISNMDVTFFAAFDKIDSPGFEGDDNAAKMYGVATFVESLGGYFEIDYAFLDDRNRTRDRSYHNIGLAYTRRYGRFISNSIRMIINAGQSTSNGSQTADGAVVLIENSLITSRPLTFVPYFNLWAGLDRPQSAARAAGAGGILRNTGILFETDGMTGYPTLDDTANDTYGAALGLNILATDFSQQLIVELAALGVLRGDPNRNAPGDQYGLGVRYQLPLSNAWILRTDGMVGFLRRAEDVSGARVELRYKF